MKKFLHEFIAFGIKQASACLFGGIMLALIIGTKLVWQTAWPIARYDFIFVAALLTQLLFLVCKLETRKEAKVIFVFHIVGTLMELFKTHVGSWEYPEANLIRLGGVPLFSGFMYSAVGSYLARVRTIFHQHYRPYPKPWTTALLAFLIYLNFFTHHALPDIRLFLFAATSILFWQTKAYFTISKKERQMPILVGFFLVSVFIWIAENVGTFFRAWVYPYQSSWELVHLGKLGSWFLLMIISFILVNLVAPPDLLPNKFRDSSDAV